jgi:hypothetical protein
VAEAIAGILREPESEALKSGARSLAKELCERFPLYPGVRPEARV